MNRRRFLGTLMASIGAAAVIDPADLLWKPAGLEGLPEVYPGAALTLDQVTAAVGLEMAKALDRHFEYVGPHAGVGHGPMRGQWNVCANPERFATLGPEGFDRALVVPVAGMLVETIKRHGYTKFGQQPLPHGELAGSNWIDPDGRMAVRGVAGVYFDTVLGDYRPLIRFDVLGG